MVNTRRHAVVLDLAAESLRRSGILRFRAQGTSMLPAIRPGTPVEIRQAAPDQIATGDIVLTRTATGLRLHRLVEIRPGSLVTRGDNHGFNDQPCLTSDLLG